MRYEKGFYDMRRLPENGRMPNSRSDYRKQSGCAEKSEVSVLHQTYCEILRQELEFLQYNKAFDAVRSRIRLKK